MLFIKTGQTLDSIVSFVDKVKKKTEPASDKLLAIGAGNAAYIDTLLDIIDNSQFSDTTNDILMMLGGAVWGAGNYLALKSDKTEKIRNGVRAINRKVDSLRPLSWLKTAGIATALTLSSLQVKPYAEQFYDEISSHLLKKEPLVAVEPIETEMPRITQISRNRPEIYDSLNHERLVDHSFEGVRLANKETPIGRIQRTLRWQPIYRTIEEKYGIPQDILAGMIMQESYGNPVQPNSRNDGGLGVVHVQGPTAKDWGLKIHGDSDKSSDRAHGMQIRQLLQNSNYDPTVVQEFDERTHLIKVLDTAARIVSKGKDRHGTWEYGIQFYRIPGKIGRNTAWEYGRDVLDWKDRINNDRQLANAERDFNQRNEMSFDDYINKFHEMSNNWGLEDYIANHRD
ncbi:hypothetical protein CL617_01970 [archaeon]|nr:hypothetical protein [archaeon]|tara:strand:+ start:1171 stop:2364 length:1194 start_codon:yes stop_codon:yes gene_type:complete